MMRSRSVLEHRPGATQAKRGDVWPEPPKHVAHTVLGGEPLGDLSQNAGGSLPDAAPGAAPGSGPGESSPPATRLAEATAADPAPNTTKPVVAEGRKKRRGPEPGTVKPYATDDRKFFPKMRYLMKKEHKSRTAAAKHIAPQLKGGGTADSRAARLAALFRDENKTR
jgi:hypothetical protein